MLPGEPPGDSADLTVEELGSRIVAGAGRLAAATCRWLLLVAAFDEREGYRAFGLWSSAQWLGHYCGLARRTALEHLRVARALAACPRLAEEMTAGRLSFSQVRAISRVLQPDDDDLLDALIASARHGTVGQLETLVRGLRTVDQLADPDPEAGSGAVSTGWTSEGHWRLTARLDPEEGALVAAALTAAARQDDEQLPPGRALVRLAQIALAAINDAATPPRRLRSEERAAIVVHVDAHDLAPTARVRSRERTSALGCIHDGPGLPAPVLERLLCTGRIRTVLEDRTGDGPPEIREVGRSHRTVTDRPYRALLLRHHGSCAYPGCTSRAALDAHHVQHWIDGGPTELGNLLLLCAAHHASHHAGAYTITALPGQRFRFIRADGHAVPNTVDPTSLTVADPFSTRRDAKPHTPTWPQMRPPRT